MDNTQSQSEIVDRTVVEDAAKAHGEPYWFIDRRLAALDKITDLSWPVVQRFDYKDLNLTPIFTPGHQRSDKALMTEVSELQAASHLVQVGQTTMSVDIPDELDDAGVILTDIFTAFREHPRLTERYFMSKVIKDDEDRLTAYHTAMLNAGAFLYIPKDVHIKDPIAIHLMQDITKNQPLISHVLIVAEEGSSVSVVEHLTTVGEKGATTEQKMTSCVTEILARPDSNVDFASVDEFGDQTINYLNRRAYIGKNATVNWAIGLMNGGSTVGDFDAELRGEGSKSDTKVVAVTTNDQKVGINTRVTNRGKHSVGNIVQRGVILEKSTLIFDGIGHIIHGASGANAEQESRVLMMSDDAHGDANPILLIDENDVLAGHAASVGQVDQNQLYYLMSRGIDRAQAQRLVIRGFLGAVISAIPTKEVRQELIDTVERKLSDGQQL